MSPSLKISGKKVAIPPTDQKKWKFEVRPGGWIIGESETGQRCRFVLNVQKGRFSASVGGWPWFGEWSSDRVEGKGAERGSDSDLIAQFPGKVRKILVETNAHVEEGAALVLVEAMKMEFAIRAPFAGTVIQLLVQEGQQLSPGDRLLDLKEQGEESGG